jgi:Ni/Co efflux regulator RcnB
MQQAHNPERSLAARSREGGRSFREYEIMRILILAAVAGAIALPATAASAQRYGYGYGYGNQREVRQETRECRRELRRADSRREYRRELRECRREIAQAQRGNRYGYRGQRGRYWDGYRWRSRGY